LYSSGPVETDVPDGAVEHGAEPSCTYVFADQTQYESQYGSSTDTVPPSCVADIGATETVPVAAGVVYVVLARKVGVPRLFARSANAQTSIDPACARDADRVREVAPVLSSSGPTAASSASFQTLQDWFAGTADSSRNQPQYPPCEQSLWSVVTVVATVSPPPGFGVMDVNAAVAAPAAEGSAKVPQTTSTATIA
jgi:hypothetical protein